MVNAKKNPARRQKNALWGTVLDWLRYQLAKKPWPVWILIVMDLLLVGIFLLVFAYFHHVIPKKQEATGIVSQRGGSVAATVQPDAAVETVLPGAADGQIVQETVQPATTPVNVEPTPAPDPVGYFGTKFADKFTSGEVIETPTSYQSDDVNITLTAYDEQGVQFWVADIYVKDIACFQTALAKDSYGSGYSEWPADINARLGGVIAINGDYYGLRKDGTVVRNGVLYREDEHPSRDVCVLYWDGTMVAYPGGSFDAEAEMAKGAYQIWNFGPMLLDGNGTPLSSFNTDVNPRNPRTVLGYYEPGHYCFVVVDGRSDRSAGLKMSDLAALMQKLGCTQAYNLDGGQTSEMVVGSTVVNNPYKGGRKCSDILMIVDP